MRDELLDEPSLHFFHLIAGFYLNKFGAIQQQYERINLSSGDQEMFGRYLRI